MRIRKNVFLILLSIICSFYFQSTALSADHEHYNPDSVLASDGFLYCVWLDADGSSATRGNVYCQKFDTLGIKQWANDKQINSAEEYWLSGWELTPKITEYNNNLYIVWCGSVGNDLVMQKLDANGNLLWASPKKVNVNQPPEYLSQEIDVDSTGNIYVMFRRYGPAGGGYYLQKVNSDGIPQWATDSSCGVSLKQKLAVSNNDTIYVLSSVTLTDFSTVGILRRFNTSGSQVWDINTSLSKFNIDTDSSNNAVVTGVANNNVVIKKYNTSGNQVGSTVTVIDSSIVSDCSETSISVDASNNVFVACKGKKLNFSNDIYVMKISSSGSLMWAEEKIAHTYSFFEEERPNIVADQYGGAIVVWQDSDMWMSPLNIRANFLNHNGDLLLTFEDALINSDGKVAGNSSPYVTSSPVLSAEVGKLYKYDIMATDNDGDTLTYSVYRSVSGTTGLHSGINQATGEIDWYPQDIHLGIHDTILLIEDSVGNFTTQHYYLEVTEPTSGNNDPVITSTPENLVSLGSQYQYDVEATDPDGDAISFAFGGPEGFSIDSSTGLITGDTNIPGIGFFSMYVFVSDVNGGWDEQSFVLEIAEASNNPPVFTSSPVLTATPGVLWTYSPTVVDPDGDTLTFYKPASPAFMTVNSSTGSLSWTPLDGQVGSNFVRLLADDGNGGTTTQEFYIICSPTNWDPVIDSITATPSSVFEQENTTVTCNASDADGDTLSYYWHPSPAIITGSGSTVVVTMPEVAGDTVIEIVVTVSDGNGGSTWNLINIPVYNKNNVPVITSSAITSATEDSAYTYDVNATDSDGDTITYSLTVKPTGMVINSSTGLISWTPSQTNVGSNSVTISISDGNGGTDTQSYNLNVINVNDAPVITSSAITSATEDSAYTYDVNATDQDGDTLVYSLAVKPTGMAINSSTGLISWTPVQSNVGSNSVSISINDGNGGTDTQSYNLNVINVNDAPVITSDPTANQSTINENETSSISVSATDQDGDSLTYSWSVTGGSISGTGSNVTFNPPDVSTQTSFTVSLTVSDGNGGQDSGNVNIIVNPVTTSAGYTPWSINENGTLYTGLAWNYTLGYHFTPSKTGSINKLGGFFSGTKTVYLWNKSTGQLLAQAAVTSSNSWSYTDISPVSVQAGTTYTVAAYLSGSGATYRSGVSGFPRTYGDITITGSSYAAGNARPTNTITTIMYGQADVSFVADGGTGNSVPQITSTPVTSAVVDQAYSYDVKATDADGDTLSYALSTYPTGMSINAATGVISWTPSSSQVSSHSVTVSVSDGNGGNDTQTFSITVSTTSSTGYTPWNTNENGTLYVDRAWNYTLGYHFTPSKSGSINKLGGFFNGTKTVYLWNKSTGQLLTQATVTSSNSWSYTDISPVSVQAGTTYTVAAYLSGSGGSYRSGVSGFPRTYGDITITGSSYAAGNARPTNTITTLMYGQADVSFVADGGTGNSAPQISSTPVTSAVVDQAYSYDVNASDQDGDTLIYSLISYPTGMTINAATGVISWTPSSSQVSSHSVTVAVSDGNGGTDTQTFTVTVSTATASGYTPWNTNENGTLRTNMSWNYTLGYHFTPIKSGSINKLGGLFNGTKTVYLWNKSTGQLIASATVTSSNSWSYTDISPVSVQAGTTYTVAAYLSGSGGSYRSGIAAFPRTYGDITITGSTYAASNARPTNTITTIMYGQADVSFIAD
ncbi:MAG: tandem-95 repeat protein [Candidatus Aureabacteria bacterium]|nr:tandem-95 repeat protein [Candidatus Auribacterota bacterium]